MRKDTDKTICLIVLPLNAIEIEQYSKLFKIGGDPIILDGSTNSYETRKQIASGRATHGERINNMTNQLLK